MTVRIYYSDPYKTNCVSQVEAVVARDGKYHVVLDQTIFYPEGGGQPSDMGFVDGSPVEHVYEQADKVYHILSTKPAEGKVHCAIDENLRLYHMQHHTGQHLLSAVWQSLLGFETKSFHLGKNYCSIDLNGPIPKEDQIAQVEDQVNTYIRQNLPITTHLVDRGQLAQFPVRNSVELKSDIRLVEISGLDYSPCCGTHLSSTGQIGMLKIIKVEKEKEFARIYFLCAERALLDYRRKHNISKELSLLLTTSEEELVTRVSAELANLKQLTKENRALREEVLKSRAANYVSSADGSVVRVCLPHEDSTNAQELAAAIAKQGDYLAIVSHINRVILAHNGRLPIHCGATIKDLAPQYGGKGGGSERSAQGYFPEEHKLFAFIEQLARVVTS